MKRSLEDRVIEAPKAGVWKAVEVCSQKDGKVSSVPASTKVCRECRSADRSVVRNHICMGSQRKKTSQIDNFILVAVSGEDRGRRRGVGR